jgi:uncharacterized protein YqcC (DUF446 family)
MRPDPTNDDNFRRARWHLRQNIPAWTMQLEFALQHPVTLDLDFDSLHDNYALVQPFIQQLLTGALAAISQVAFDPVFKPLAPQILHVALAALPTDTPCQVSLADQTLTIRGPLHPELPAAPATPLTDAIAAHLRALATGQPVASVPVSTRNDSENIPTTPSQPAPDLYTAATQFIVDLESALRAANAWPGPPPPGPLDVRGAFGCESMPFEHWLAWVLIPRIREIVATRGQFPESSSLATYAIRNLDPGADALITLLANFDDLINSTRR